jgi:hypothetical protein
MKEVAALLVLIGMMLAATQSQSKILQYGFFSSDAPAGARIENYTPDIAAFSNITWIGSWHGSLRLSIERIRKDLQSARVAGLGAVIGLETFLFCDQDDHGGQTNCGNSYRLSPTWRSDVDSLWKEIRSESDSIKGFYVIDEPFERFPWTSAVNNELVSNINRVTSYLHSIAPGIPTISIYNLPGRRYSLSQIARFIPRRLDWIGYDCYYSAWYYRGQKCGPTLLTSGFRHLTRAKSPRQKLVLVPDVWWSSEAPDAPDDVLLASRIKLYQTLARTFSDVVALYAFIYQDFYQGIGVQSLPRSREKLIEWFGTLSRPRSTFLGLSRLRLLHSRRSSLAVTKSFRSNRCVCPRSGQSTALQPHPPQFWKSLQVPSAAPLQPATSLQDKSAHRNSQCRKP